MYFSWVWPGSYLYFSWVWPDSYLYLSLVWPGKSLDEYCLLRADKSFSPLPVPPLAGSKVGRAAVVIPSSIFNIKLNAYFKWKWIIIGFYISTWASTRVLICKNMYLSKCVLCGNLSSSISVRKTKVWFLLHVLGLYNQNVVTPAEIIEI